MPNDIVNYQEVIADIKGMILSGREVAYNAANKAMVLTYWDVGKRIVEQEQAGKERENMVRLNYINRKKLVIQCKNERLI